MTNPVEISKTNPNEFRITQLLFGSQHASGTQSFSAFSYSRQ